MSVTLIECCDEVWSPDALLEEHLAPRHNKCQWTYELAKGMLEGAVAHPSHDDPSRISTTVLTSKCLRRLAFERHSDITTTLEDMWPSFRGTMFHRQMESLAHPGSYGEARFFVDDMASKIPALRQLLPRQNRSFSGSPDLVDPEVGILYDYKRTKAVPRFNTVWSDHVEQLNINRWLVDHADYVEHAAPGEQPTRYDLTDSAAREKFIPVEWQGLVIVYVDDQGPKPITVTASIDVPKAGGVGTKKARVPDIWADDVVEHFITERYEKARIAINQGIAPIPQGWEHQSHPLCGWCPFRMECAKLELQGE